MGEFGIILHYWAFWLKEFSHTPENSTIWKNKPPPLVSDCASSREDPHMKKPFSLYSFKKEVQKCEYVWGGLWALLFSFVKKTPWKYPYNTINKLSITNINISSVIVFARHLGHIWGWEKQKNFMRSSSRSSSRKTASAD